MKHNHTSYIIRIMALALAGLMIFGLWGCSAKPGAPEATTEAAETTAADPGALFVQRIFDYSGPFMEDGSDKEVKNIVAAVLVNTTPTDYEYVEFCVNTDKGTHSFTASGIKAGSTVTVLCQNKDKFEKDEAMKDFTIDAKAEYAAPPTVPEDVFEVYYTGANVSVKNIGTRDLTDLCVYYKQTNDEGFLGGITYRTKISALKAGEITQLNGEHMDAIINITYHE